jgi:hypothetical protein
MLATASLGRLLMQLLCRSLQKNGFSYSGVRGERARLISIRITR